MIARAKRLHHVRELQQHRATADRARAELERRAAIDALEGIERQVDELIGRPTETWTLEEIAACHQAAVAAVACATQRCQQTTLAAVTAGHRVHRAARVLDEARAAVADRRVRAEQRALDEHAARRSR